MFDPPYQIKLQKPPQAAFPRTCCPPFRQKYFGKCTVPPYTFEIKLPPLLKSAKVDGDGQILDFSALLVEYRHSLFIDPSLEMYQANISINIVKINSSH